MNRLLMIVAFAATIIAGLSGLAGGYLFAKHKTTAHFLSVQNSDLRESQKETQRQIAHVLKAQKEHRDQLEKIAESERRYRDADRMRQKSERERAIATSNVNSCRAYASTVTELFETCRAEYISLGHEAERSRSAAGALK